MINLFIKFSMYVWYVGLSFRLSKMDKFRNKLPLIAQPTYCTAGRGHPATHVQQGDATLRDVAGSDASALLDLSLSVAGCCCFVEYWIKVRSSWTQLFKWNLRPTCILHTDRRAVLDREKNKASFNIRRYSIQIVVLNLPFIPNSTSIFV